MIISSLPKFFITGTADFKGPENVTYIKRGPRIDLRELIGRFLFVHSIPVLLVKEFIIESKMDQMNL